VTARSIAGSWCRQAVCTTRHPRLAFPSRQPPQYSWDIVSLDEMFIMVIKIV
jgi:hypothetical protein